MYAHRHKAPWSNSDVSFELILSSLYINSVKGEHTQNSLGDHDKHS